MDFKDIFVNSILLSLVLIALFSFIISTQINNGVSHPISEDKLLNSTYNSLKQNVTTNVEQSNKQYQSFNEENPNIEAGSIVLSTIISGGKNFGSMIFPIYNYLIKLPIQKLGVEDYVTGSILMILIFLIILGIWFIIKGV